MSDEKNAKKKEAKKKKPSSATAKLNAQINELNEALELAKEEAESQKANALSHLAELENFRKRKNQEVDTFKKYAAENVILEFITILDNFQLASTHVSEDEQKNNTIQGFLLIQKQIESTLEKLNVSKISALNTAFDTQLHQAVSQESKEGVAPNTVTKELQAGYKLHDKVIRPAMVVVSQ